MIPSMFAPSAPFNAFQVWFVVYVYMLPIMLYGAWAALSIMDIIATKDGRWGAALAVIFLPLVGGAWYLLMRARVLNRTGRVAAVVLGSLVWLIPLTEAVWLVGRPLGTKAL
jgi:hypothetical protein